MKRVFLAIVATILAQILPVESSHSTLVLVGASTTSIYLAADSALAHKGKVESTGHQKIFPIEPKVACMIGGAARFVLPDGRHINLDLAIKDWAANNRGLELSAAFQGVNDLVLRNVDSIRGNGALDPSAAALSIGCVGFEQSKPKAIIADIELFPDAKPTSKSAILVMAPGLIMPLGETRVSEEILFGKNPAFEKFRSDALVQSYRQVPRTINESDIPQLLEKCLTATESIDAVALDPNAAYVAGPNRTAVIDANSGFRWTSQ